MRNEKKRLNTNKRNGYILDTAKFTRKYMAKVLFLAWLLVFITTLFVLQRSLLDKPNLHTFFYQITSIVALVLLIVGALIWRYLDTHIFNNLKSLNTRLQAICTHNNLPKGADFLDDWTHINYQVDQLDQTLTQTNDLLTKYKQLNLVTNLLNYKGFAEKTKQLAARTTPTEDLALVRISIDNYKLYYSLYGIEVVDELALQVSRRIQTISTNSALIGHITDKEFVLLHSSGEWSSEVQSYLVEIRKVLNTPYNLRDRHIKVNFSIGVTYLSKSHDIVKALHQTEMAVVSSEAQGGNRDIFYNPSLEKPVSAVDIQAGIENKEFYMVYQPQIDAFNGELIGFEALVRWNHPVKGFIPPDKFITVAEDENLIMELGNYILDRVFAQVHEWDKKGYHAGKVSVNTSIIQLKNIRTLRCIRTLMDKYEIKPKSIAVEITESKALEASHEIQQHLETLRGWGILVALDDFGKEYSNLSMLTDLPINFLKIDKAFIDDIQKNTPILTTIVDLAQKLDMKIIAEGVETEEQLNQLRKLRCHIIQGYYFDKPLTVETLETKYFKPKS